MLFVWKLLITLVCAMICCSRPGSGVEPSIKIRISSKGLSYARKVIESQMNYQLQKIKKLPNPKPTKNQEVRNMKLTVLQPLKFHHQLKSSGEMAWLTSSGQLRITGDFTVRQKVLLVTLSHSGSFTATASGIKIKIAFSVDRTQVTNVHCHAEISHLDLTVGGGATIFHDFVNAAINIFRGSIADGLKPSLHKKACTAVTELIENLNNDLRKFPTSINVGKSLLLDYSVPYGPMVENNGIVSYHKGEIRSKNARQPVSLKPRPMKIPALNSKMVYAYFSDYMLNTFLIGVHNQHKGSKQYTVKPNQLRTLCGKDTFCSGFLFPEMINKYPNASVKLEAKSTAAPSGIISEGKVTLQMKGKITVFVDQTGKAHKELMAFTTSISLILKPTYHILDTKVTPKITSHSASIQEYKFSKPLKNSAGKDVSKEAVHFFVNMVVPAIISSANKIVGSGIVVPVPYGLEFHDVEIKLLNRMVEVSTNVKLPWE